MGQVRRVTVVLRVALCCVIVLSFKFSVFPLRESTLSTCLFVTIFIFLICLNLDSRPLEYDMSRLFCSCEDLNR